MCYDIPQQKDYKRTYQKKSLSNVARYFIAVVVQEIIKMHA